MIRRLPCATSVSDITDFAEGVYNILNGTVLNSSSANWDSVYATVSSLSAIWAINDGSADTFVYANSGNILSVYNTVSSLSAIWNLGSADINNFVYSNSANIVSVYTTVNVNSAVVWNYQGTDIKELTATWLTNATGDARYVNLSGDIMTGSLSAPILSTGTLYVGASTIFFLNDANAVIENLKASDVTDFKLTFSTVQTNSADWANQTIYIPTSADWNSVYSTVNSNSANWDIGYNQSNILAELSANNGSVYSSVNTNSASWLTQDLAAASFLPLSGGNLVGSVDLGNNNITNINIICATEIHSISAFTQYQDITIYEMSGFGVTGNISVTGDVIVLGNLHGNGDNITNINWDSNYTTVNTNSANWNTAFDQSNILASSSANNASVYSNVNSNSATNTAVNNAFASQSANNLSVYNTVQTNSAVSWITLGKVLAASVSISF